MTPNLPRIEAALNAYPWTAGTFTARSGGEVRYCAIGMLLRYSGVTEAHIDLACNRGVVEFWSYYRPLLEHDYGIAGPEQVHAIMVANDGAASHDEAIRRVRWVLGRSPLRAADVLALCPSMELLDLAAMDEDPLPEGALAHGAFADAALAAPADR